MPLRFLVSVAPAPPMFIGHPHLNKLLLCSATVIRLSHLGMRLHGRPQDLSSVR